MATYANVGMKAGNQQIQNADKVAANAPAFGGGVATKNMTIAEAQRQQGADRSYADQQQRLTNPLYDLPTIGHQFYSDPRIARSYGGMFGAADQMKQGVNQFGQYAQNFLQPEAAQLQGMANGQGPSYVNQAAQVQRQQAQGAIGQQAMMGARGALSPAAQRQAIMGASNVQANMAGQVAAARAQERMGALNQLMQARQAQLGARTTHLGAQQAQVGSTQAQAGLVGQQKGGTLGMATDIFGKRIEGATSGATPSQL